MARQYAADVTKNVVFGIVYEHNLGNAIHNYGIKAFPTYVLFQQQREVGRVQGVNMEGIRTMIDDAGCNVTGGETLGGGTAILSLQKKLVRSVLPSFRLLHLLLKKKNPNQLLMM